MHCEDVNMLQELHTQMFSFTNMNYTAAVDGDMVATAGNDAAVSSEPDTGDAAKSEDGAQLHGEDGIQKAPRGVAASGLAEGGEERHAHPRAPIYYNDPDLESLLRCVLVFFFFFVRCLDAGTHQSFHSDNSCFIPSHIYSVLAAVC